MKHHIIKTDNYLLIVSDEEIKEGDWSFNEYQKTILRFNAGVGIGLCKKIIAHLPLNNSPILEGVDLLPPLKDDAEPDPKLIDSMAMRYRHDFGLLDKQHKDSIRTTMVQLWEEVVGKGFYKAKEKYKYTEEDLTRAFNIGINSQFESTELKLNKDESFDRHSKDLLKLIQSLQQPKMPVGFECEDEYVHDDTVPYPKTLGTHPKTIVNSQGQKELVGEYIF